MTKRPSAPGHFVQIGGAAMHAVVEGHGPPVVLESGLGGGVAEWALVAAALAPLATVVRRDRPGLGWSAPARRDRSAVAAAADLHELLHRLDVPAPYVLVGHSLGGFHLRAFAAAHPDEVAGLVFVDASHEDLFAERELEVVNAVTRQVFGLLARVVRVGGAPTMARAYAAMARKTLTRPVAPEVEEILATIEALFSTSGGWLGAMRDEYAALGESSAQMRGLRTAAGFPHVPVRVITEGRAPANARAEALLARFHHHHAQLAVLGAGGPHVVAERSGHLIPLDEPEIIVAQVGAMLDDLARSPLDG